MARNYYVVLGVAPAESERGIRLAYRDLVKRHHPDVAGPTGEPMLREITEAYEVLADPARRRAYDAALGAERVAERRHVPVFFRELSLRRDLQAARPSPDAMFARLARNFGGVLAKGERQLALEVDVALSSEEAARGARVDLAVPVVGRCFACDGHGCFACDGRGTREAERPVTVQVPPMTGSGATFLCPLHALGIQNLFLEVRVRVDRALEPPSALDSA